MSPKITLPAGIALDDVPRWLQVTVVLLVLSGVGWWAIRDPEQQLITQREANAALKEQVQEFGKHIAEAPETVVTLLDDARGKLVAQRYADGCVLLARTSSAGLRSKLIMDLALDDDVILHSTLFHWPADGMSLLYGPLSARCVDPHPGEFTTRYGERQGCWVPVFRAWADGCEHVQHFNACRGVFDATITWTRCIH